MNEEGKSSQCTGGKRARRCREEGIHPGKTQSAGQNAKIKSHPISRSQNTKDGALTSCSSGFTPGSQRASGLSCSSSGKDPWSSKAWIITKKERKKKLHSPSDDSIQSWPGKLIRSEITTWHPLEISLVSFAPEIFPIVPLKTSSFCQVHTLGLFHPPGHTWILCSKTPWPQSKPNRHSLQK